MEITNVSKYFIAIIPPSPIYEEINQLKEYCKENFNSKAALRSPPHITLHMPFQWKEAKEEKLILALQNFVSTEKGFQINLKNFSCFEPRVIFIHVKKKDSLNLFQKRLQRFCRTQLNLLNAEYKDLTFHPHVTIAFRDLKKSLFPKAWNIFREKKFEGQFMATFIALLKYDTNRWNVFREFELRG